MAAQSFKTYTVRYDIFADTTKANRSFLALSESAQILNSSLLGARDGLKNVLQQVREMHRLIGETKAMGMQITPTISLKGLVTQLEQLTTIAGDAGTAAGKAYSTAFSAALTTTGKGKGKGGAISKEQKEVVKAVQKATKEAAKTAKVTMPVSVSLSSGAELNKMLQQTINGLQGRVKPIVIPVTLVSDINAGKMLRGTAGGLQGVANGSKVVIPASGGRGKVVSASAIGASGSSKVTSQLKSLVKTAGGMSADRIPAITQLTRLFSAVSKLPVKTAESAGTVPVIGQITRLVGKVGSMAEVGEVPVIGQVTKVINAANKKVPEGAVGVLGEVTKIINSAKSPTPKGAVGVVGEVTKIINAAKAPVGEGAVPIIGEVTKVINAAKAPVAEGVVGVVGEVTKVINAASKITAEGLVPVTGIVSNVIVDPKGVKMIQSPVTTGASNQKTAKGVGKTGVQPLPVNAKGAKGTKTVLSGISAANITKKVESLERLNMVLSKLPAEYSRNYTIKLSVTGVDKKIAQLERLIPLLMQLPPDVFRNYRIGASGNVKNTGGNTPVPVASTSTGRPSTGGNSYISASGYGNRAIITPRNARKVSMNSLGYHLFGNTSFGARTPMFLDMMKGMGVMTGVGAAMSTISNAFTNAAEYQNTMLTARAILGENYKGDDFSRDFKEMTEIVRNVAKQTKFTAPQAADAARFMAMAGLNIPMINAAISPIADVAVIGDNDLGEVADKMTNIMTAFNLKPQNMRHLADALTKTFTSTNTDMMMLAESMQYAAPMAHLAGADVEEALAMIGIMGNAGIQGSMAGTTLRMMYQNIIKPNKNQAKMWAKLGISTTDANGHTRNIIDILSDLRGKLSFKDAKDMEGNWKDEGTPVAKAVSELFRVTASAGAGTLLENLDKVKALVAANQTVTGLSESVSQVKQNDVKGMWAKLTSAFTDAVVSEFESSESVIKKYLGSITEYLKSEEFKKTLHDIFELVTALADIMGKVANIWKFMVNSLGGMYTWVLQAQFLFHQLSFIATPFRQLWQVGAKTRGALHGVSGMGGLGLAGFGGMAAASTVGAGGVGSRLGKYYALPATGAIALRDGLTARGIYGGISHPFTESGLVRAGGSYQSVGLRKPWASSQTIMPFMPFLPPHTSSANAMRASTAMRASSLRFTNPLVQSSAGFRASIAGIGKKRLNKLQASIIARQNEAMATSASIAMQRGRNAYALDALILASGLAGTQYRYYAGPHGRAFASQAHLIRPMAVQPFGKFNYNSPSAVLHGGMPQVRFAREYDKRAKAFERGANALRRSGASMERIELAQKRAEAYARAAQQATPKRPQRLSWQTALLRERAERIYTARGRFGANFGKLTSWGMAGMNAAAIGSFLKSKTLSLAGFGGKAAGLLLNPLTLAGAALGIPLMVSISRSLKASETRNATHASIVQNAKNTQELLRTSTSGFSLADALSGIKEINVNTASINVDKQTQTPNAVPLSAKEEYAQILNLIGGTPKKGDSVGRMGDILVTDDWKGLNEAYDAMAAPMSKYISSIETGRRGLALAQKDERTRARDIMKGLIGQQALESPEFASAKNKISDIYTEFGNLPKEEQAQKYYAMRSEVMSILNQYNPSGMNLPQITTHNYLKAKTASPTSFYEYYETIHNALEEFYENSPAIKAIEAMQGLSADAEDWWKRIGDIISGIPMSGLSDSQGKSVSVTVPIEEGRFRFDKFLRILNDNNVTLVDATSEYMEWLEKAYDSMFNNPLLKELIGNLSKDDFLSHFRNVNYGVWSYIQPWAGYRANVPAANTDKDKEGTGELLKRPSQTPIKLGYPKQDGYSSKYSFSSRANGGTANVNISSMTINTNGANNEAIAQNAGEQFYEVLLNALNNNA